MSKQRAVKLLHAASTAWFLMAAAYLAILALRQAGVNWWVIFSLSGYSAGSAFVLISAYLFAIFRSSSRSQSCSIEHPLTSSRQYMVLYSLIPFLGALAGALCKVGIESPIQAAGTIVMGTLWATFGFWIIIDPLIAICESLLPGARAHRLKRISDLRDLKSQQNSRRQEILQQLENQELADKALWQKDFSQDAITLAAIAHDAKNRKTAGRGRAVEIGLVAFKRGGLECMQVVMEMAVEAAKRNGSNGTTDLLISTWWDGIGNWRDTCPFYAEN